VGGQLNVAETMANWAKTGKRERCAVKDPALLEAARTLIGRDTLGGGTTKKRMAREETGCMGTTHGRATRKPNVPRRLKIFSPQRKKKTQQKG